MEANAPLSQALEEINENRPLPKVFKLEQPKVSSRFTFFLIVRFKLLLTKLDYHLSCPCQKSTTSKNNVSGQNKQDSSFVGPPMKVEWVLDNPRGDSWSPFISETLVPDSVKKQWTSRFEIVMNDGIENSQNSCAFR